MAFANWLQRIPQWLADGKQPYLFIHTPDNNQAPELATRLYQQLQQQLGEANKLPDIRLPDLNGNSSQITLL